MAGRRRTRRNAGADLRLTDGEALLLVAALREYTVALTDEAEDREDEAQYAVGDERETYRRQAKQYREMEQHAKSVAARLRSAGYSLAGVSARWDAV